MSSKYRALFLQSDEGRQNEDGSQSTFTLNPPLMLPKRNGYEWLCSVRTLNIPYVQHNITETKYYRFKFSYNNIPHQTIVEPGLYTLENLNSKLLFYTRELTDVITPLFNLQADESTGKIFIVANTINGFALLFDDNTGSNVFGICGFPNTQTQFAPNLIGEMYQSSTEAIFDQLQQINIHVSFCSGSDSYIGNNASDVVASISPNVSPQSRILYEYQQPIITGIPHEQINEFTVSIKDQNNNLLNFNPTTSQIENWNLTLQLWQEQI